MGPTVPRRRGVPGHPLRRSHRAGPSRRHRAHPAQGSIASDPVAYDRHVRRTASPAGGRELATARCSYRSGRLGARGRGLLRLVASPRPRPQRHDAVALRPGGRELASGVVARRPAPCHSATPPPLAPTSESDDRRTTVGGRGHRGLRSAACRGPTWSCSCPISCGPTRWGASATRSRIRRTSMPWPLEDFGARMRGANIRYVGPAGSRS